MVSLLALGAKAASTGLQFRPSRAVTFQTLSLLVIGLYLLVMVLASSGLALLDEDIARASQMVFVIVALAAVLGTGCVSPRPNTCSSTAMTTARNGYASRARLAAVQALKQDFTKGR